MRFDLAIIASWIEPGSRVLDLGCGSGDLLDCLRREKNVSGIGIEKDEEQVADCIARGLSVIHGDLNEEVRDFSDQAFDTVIVSQTLQQVYDPEKLLVQLLRIGRRVVVSFPNFAHWQVRLQLLFRGQAPLTRDLPGRWFSTPNIRVITLRDFREFTRDHDFVLVKEAAISTNGDRSQGRIITCCANLRARYGIMMIAQKRS